MGTGTIVSSLVALLYYHYHHHYDRCYKVFNPIHACNPSRRSCPIPRSFLCPSFSIADLQCSAMQYSPSSAHQAKQSRAEQSRTLTTLGAAQTVMPACINQSISPSALVSSRHAARLTSSLVESVAVIDFGWLFGGTRQGKSICSLWCGFSGRCRRYVGAAAEGDVYALEIFEVNCLYSSRMHDVSRSFLG